MPFYSSLAAALILRALSIPGVLNRRTPVRIRTQTQSNVDRSQNQNFNLNHDPSEFSLLRDFVLYIFFLFDVVSIFRVQSRGPIRSCNNNITMTTHSLNVGRELCGSRRLCVSMATTRADRFVNGICLSAIENYGGR